MQQKRQKPVNHTGEDTSFPIIEQAQQEVARSRVPWYRASKRARVFIALYVLEFLLFSLLAWVVSIHPVLPLDVAITREFQENHSLWLRSTMIAVNYLGFHILIFSALIFGTAVVFWIMHLSLEALFVVALSIINSVFNVVLKVLVNRPRPNARLVEIIQHASGQSFPSGHVMSYVAFFGLVFSLGIILLKRDRWWHYVVLIVPALFVVLVGPARIYVGDHWASDVLGAYLFGSLLLGIALWMYLALKSKGVFSTKMRRGEMHSDSASPNVNPRARA